MESSDKSMSAVPTYRYGIFRLTKDEYQKVSKSEVEETYNMCLNVAGTFEHLRECLRKASDEGNFEAKELLKELESCNFGYFKSILDVVKTNKTEDLIKACNDLQSHLESFRKLNFELVECKAGYEQRKKLRIRNNRISGLSAFGLIPSGFLGGFGLLPKEVVIVLCCLFAILSFASFLIGRNKGKEEKRLSNEARNRKAEIDSFDKEKIYTTGEHVSEMVVLPGFMDDINFALSGKKGSGYAISALAKELGLLVKYLRSLSPDDFSPKLADSFFDKAKFAVGRVKSVYNGALKIGAYKSSKSPLNTTNSINNPQEVGMTGKLTK